MRKRIIASFLQLFFLLGVVGLVLRSIRNEWIAVPDTLFSLVDNNFVVGIEHLFAGVGVPAGIAATFLLLSLIGQSKGGLKLWQKRITELIESPIYYWLFVMLGGFGYGWHIFEHEFRQTEQAGYWGTPKVYLDNWQIIIGVFGIFIFWIYAYFRSKHNQ